MPADDIGHEDAVDADRRERPGQRPVDDHHAHEQQVHPVAAGEGHGQRGHDRHREQCADRRQKQREEEEDPRHRREPSADQAHAPLHQEIDGAVVLSQREQVGQSNEQHE
jgi:hypothetical protein